MPSSCPLPSPFPDRLGVLRVMAVRVKPQASPEACFPRELFFRHALEIVDKPAVGVVPLSHHLGEGHALLLLSPLGVESIDAAVCGGISRRLPAVEDVRQMCQRLLLPPRHVCDEVSDRPGAGDTRLYQLRIRETGVRFLEVHPCLVKSFQKLLSIHGSCSLVRTDSMSFTRPHFASWKMMPTV